MPRPTPPQTIAWEGVIAIEGRDTEDGRYILPGALSWDTPFPLTARYGDSSFLTQPIGTVDDIYRVGDHIVALGSVHRGLLHPGDGLGMSINRVWEEGEDTYTFRVSRACISSVLASSDIIPAWPECLVTRLFVHEEGKA